MSDTIKLTSGREFNANCGIVGIDAELDVFGGYDQGIDGAGLYDDHRLGRWPADDRVALADMMIERWAAFKAQAKGEAPIASEPVAVLRYDRSHGNENEMPKVVSCNWLPDGEYEVFLKLPTLSPSR